jgi:hypothetical protein
MLKSKCCEALGFIIIMWTIYRILILVRIPYEINEKISWLLFNIILCMILCYTITLYTTLTQLFTPTSRVHHPLLAKTLEIFYSKPLQTTIVQLLTWKILAEHWATVLESSIKELKTIYFVTFTIILLPRAVISLALFLDVFILNKILGFYKVIWLIAIPLIFSSVLAIVNHYITSSQTNLEVNTIQVKSTNPHYYCTISFNRSCIF